MLHDIARVRPHVRSSRRSSWDTSGRNIDYLVLKPGDTVTLLDEDGPGRVTHFYWTTINAGRFHYRQLVLRAWWDGEPHPSVEVPLGDLFGVPHCTPVPLRSLGVVVNPGSSEVLSWGFNLYLPMPFHSSARMELTYEPIPGHPADDWRFWYHIDLEKQDEPVPADTGRFHAQWRRENPTVPARGVEPNSPVWNGVNLGGTENYVALQAEGAGQMVGLHLQVDNLGGGWYGEGDDMVFVDGRLGAQWPPTYHGTGSEEIFGGGASPNRAYDGPYSGFHLVENANYSGKNAMYRWYLQDPIRFQRSLVWTIEHGHDNNYANDYASVAYWYQIEPHAPFDALPGADARLPRYPDIVTRADAARARLSQRISPDLVIDMDIAERRRLGIAMGRGIKAIMGGRYAQAIRTFESALE